MIFEKMLKKVYPQNANTIVDNPHIENAFSVVSIRVFHGAIVFLLCSSDCTQTQNRFTGNP